MAIEMRQDGGWAWCICFGSFFVSFVTSAYLNCGGVVLSALVDNFGIPRSEAAWVTALPASCMYLFAPLSTFLCNRYGARLTIVLGAIIAAFSLVTSSFATNVKILYFTYGIAGGLGSSLVYYPNFVIMSIYFKKKISTANGIATSGGSVGTFIMSPVIQLLFSKLGLSHGLRFLAAFHLVLLVPVLLFRPFPEAEESNAESKQSKWLGTDVFKNRNFIIWLVAVFLFQLNYMVPYIHLVRLGEDVGASKVTASFLISILAGSSFIGRTLCGRIADLACCNRLRIVQAFLFCIGISTALVAFAPSFPLVATYAGVFGVSEGVYIALFMVLTRDIVGVDSLSFALGVAYSFLSIPKTLGPLLAGLLFDYAQNYILPFTLMGGLTVLSVFLMFFINTSKRTLPCCSGDDDKNDEVEFGIGKRSEVVMNYKLLVVARETTV